MRLHAPLALLAPLLLLCLTASPYSHAATSAHAAPRTASSSSDPSRARSLDQSDSGFSALVFDWGQGSSVHDPVSLTGANFFDLVLDSRQGWLVAFVAPWCGHCQALHKPFQAASRALASTVRLGIVDATKETSLAQQFKIAGYPTLLTFPAGKKTPKSMSKYEGTRDSAAIEAHARGMLNRRAMKQLSSNSDTDRLSASLRAFFTGSSRSNHTASLRPSLLLFLHSHAPTDEQKALSQIFAGRVNCGVVGREDRALAKMFRVRSRPSYVLCAPAVATTAGAATAAAAPSPGRSAIDTGAVWCGLYDHASKGGNVPSIARFVVDFIKDTTTATDASAEAGAGAGTTADWDATKRKYGLRSVIIDEAQAKRHEAMAAVADGGASAAGAAISASDNSAASPAASSTSPLPPLVFSAVDFHARCTDTPLGACLLLFVEPAAWVAASSTGSDAHAVAATYSALQELMDELRAWNARHASRKSLQLSPLLLSTSSALAAALSDAFSASLDVAPAGVTLLALLPRRNRFSLFADHSPAPGLDVPSALEWAESIVRGEKRKLAPAKMPDMQARMRRMLPVEAGAGVGAEAEADQLLTPTFVPPTQHTKGEEEGQAAGSDGRPQESASATLLHEEL